MPPTADRSYVAIALVGVGAGGMTDAAIAGRR